MLRLLCALLFALCCFFGPPKPPKTAATVYIFLATDCPIAQKYGPKFAQMAGRYKEKGIVFQGVFPNATETEEKIKVWGQERKIAFPLVRDTQNISTKLRATTTPEVIFTNPAGKILYRGNPDNLSSALDAFLAKKSIKTAQTKPVGCLLTPKAIPSPAHTVTYAAHVAPVLNKHCVVCHRAGEVGAMPLDSYENASAWAAQIVKVTQDKTMPPWKADSKGVFRDEKRLEDAEKETLKAWLDAKMPLGEKEKIPSAPTFPPRDAWQLGKPDALFSMPKPFVTSAEGKDIYRCFVIPAKKGTDSTDMWLKGIEFKPGNRKIVHHVSVFADISGEARRLDAKDIAPGYTNPTPGNGPGFSTYFATLGGWTPGHAPIKLPEGVGLLVPKNADLVMEVHYAVTGKSETDTTQFGIYYAPESEKIEKRLRIGAIGATKLTLPAGEKNIEIKGDEFCPEDITLFSITPHMHFLGTRMVATAQLPDGSRKDLIDVPRWDFNWQPSYRFLKPVKLPRSTRIDVKAYYDNSATNPHNPNKPPKEVHWGESTTDEMCSCFIAYTIDSEHLNTAP
jgi:mono/diheme cytochrome c family protein